MKSDIRQIDINRNHWYAVARSGEVGDRPVGITLWQEPIALFRDAQGVLHALADRCPHRFIKLSRGVVIGDSLECAYHGWRISGEGRCSLIPYLEEHQKLPTITVRRYPTMEKQGFVWVFPGEVALSETVSPLDIPEWEDLNYIASIAPIDCQCHFSFLIENLMDMYHGHLHQHLQAWADPKLETLTADNQQVAAVYAAQSFYRIDRIWSMAQLFIPALRQLHSEPLQVIYRYPHWMSTLGQDFKIYCLFCPIDAHHTRAYLLHFTSLQAFPRLHKLPKFFRLFIKNIFFNAAQSLLKGLIDQDVVMLEDEQAAYDRLPMTPIEINRTLIGVQKLIRKQAIDSFCLSNPELE